MMLKLDLGKLVLFQPLSIPRGHFRDCQALCERWLVFLLVLLLLEGVQQRHQQMAGSSASPELPKAMCRGGDSASCKRSPRFSHTILLPEWGFHRALNLLCSLSAVSLNHNHLSRLRNSAAQFYRAWAGKYIYSCLLVSVRLPQATQLAGRTTQRFLPLKLRLSRVTIAALCLQGRGN